MSAVVIEFPLRARWQSDAACRDTDVDVFFPFKTRKVNTFHMYDEALAICAGCPVKTQCLEEGLDQPFGVWGGTTPRHRVRLRGRRFRIG